MNSISRDLIESYCYSLGLPSMTVELLSSEKITFQKISDGASQDLEDCAKRLYDLDQYRDDPTVQQDSLEDLVCLVSEEGLNATGFFLQLASKDVGCSVLYKILNKSNNLTPNYIAMSHRACWPDIMKYMQQSLNMSSLQYGQVYHLYDYAIAQGFRTHGLGRLLLRYTMDACVSTGEVLIGFVDVNRMDSIIATTIAGGIVGRVLEPSPDGAHSSFIMLYSPSAKIEYHQTLDYARGDPLPKLRSEILRAQGSAWLVGYDHSDSRFKTVRVT